MSVAVGTPGLVRLRSGHAAYPLDPRPADFAVADLAHQLANLCRFNGAVSTFYSVAEHAVRCSLAAMMTDEPRELQLLLLHHDDGEMLMGDLPAPLKETDELAVWREIEERIDVAVSEAFGLAWPWDPRYKLYDNRLVATEIRDLLPPNHFHPKAEPLDKVIVPWSPVRARREFLKRHRKLTA